VGGGFTETGFGGGGVDEVEMAYERAWRRGIKVRLTQETKGKGV